MGTEAMKRLGLGSAPDTQKWALGDIGLGVQGLGCRGHRACLKEALAGAWILLKVKVKVKVKGLGYRASGLGSGLGFLGFGLELAGFRGLGVLGWRD